jgi:ferredoxin
LGESLWSLPSRDGSAAPRSFLPLGSGPGLTRFALRELHAGAPVPADVVPLPAGAPFGQVAVDTHGCTLCLACTMVCPTGALTASQDRPALSFTEDSCVQCGLCRTTCPEQVISLVPRLDFREEARRAVLLKEEEPYHCLRCGKPFGTRASIERIIEKLSASKHWMFAGSAAALDRMRMCGDCRVIAQTETSLDPFTGPPRPVTVTTDDYKW